MPCTQNDEQDQHGAQGTSYRSTFRRNFAALRASYQQSLQGFAMQQASHHQLHLHHHHRTNQQLNLHSQQTQQQQLPNVIAQDLSQNHHHPHAIINNPEDLTEQIRISVQDTHISHGSFVNDLGGNISDVLDSFDEENILSYGNNNPHHHAQPQLAQHQEHISNQDPTDHVRSSIDNYNQYIHHAGYYVTPGASSSSSTSPSSSRADIYAPQTSSTSSSLQQQQQPPRSRLVVLDTKDCNNKQQSTHPHTIQARFSSGSNGTKPEPTTNDRNDTTETNSTHQPYVDHDNNNGQSNGHRAKKQNQLETGVQQLKKKQQSSDEKHDSQKEKDELDYQKTRDRALTIISDSCVHPFNEIAEHQKLSSLDHIPSYTKNHQVGVIRNYLFNGSSFSGYQKSKNESYEVNVKIQHVDFNNSYLCGYLCIAHLTKTHPSLTTFFEGEIISERYPFLTRKWEATEEIDRAHWSKFEGFGERYSQSFNLDSFNYDELGDSDYIYMRWKEHFLVPDHTIKHVEGASYAGFYYICYSKRTSQIKGYYFHINSEHFESFQSLNLELDCQERTSQVYEFR